MSFTPNPEKMRRYLPDRRPYVEVTTGERKIHAQVIAWQADMILIEYPPTMIDKFTHGQREVEWIHKTRAVRIRREDSIWAHLEDDYAGHGAQDAKISYRPDPWNIYEQEFPQGQ
jgi:hypothetical protein